VKEKFQVYQMGNRILLSLLMKNGENLLDLEVVVILALGMMMVN
jgi:hypothetical protein